MLRETSLIVSQVANEACNRKIKMCVSLLWETYSGFLRVRVLVTEGYKLLCGPILEGQMHQGKILGAGRHFKHRQQHIQRGRAWNNSLHGETFLIGPTRNRSFFILPLCLISSHILPLKHLWCVCGGSPKMAGGSWGTPRPLQQRIQMLLADSGKQMH